VVKMNLISFIQKTLSSKIETIDSLVYRKNYNYLETPEANMTFPELGGIDPFRIVARPNKNSSVETKKELKYIANLANNRSVEEINLIYEVDADPMGLFQPVIEELGIEFPYLKFNTIYRNMVLPLTIHLKNYYNRARPFQLEEYYDIKIDRLITNTHHTPSYPSGHVMYASLIGEILFYLFPEKKNIFDNIVQKVALCRVLQGVHFPSDNEASIKIMEKIYPKLSDYYEKK